MFGFNLIIAAALFLAPDQLDLKKYFGDGSGDAWHNKMEDVYRNRNIENNFLYLVDQLRPNFFSSQRDFPNYDFWESNGIPFYYQLQPHFQPPDAGCVPIVRQIESITRKYFLRARDGGGTSLELYEKILNTLQDLENSNSPCFQPAVAGYILSSLISFNAPMKPNAALLALIFFIADKLKFLTPKVRTEMGDIYETKMENGKYLVQGAYDCEKTIIYIDPYQPPINLAASIQHEQDHFFRDKFPDASVFHMSPEASVLLDETLAASSAAFFQIFQARVLMGRHGYFSQPNAQVEDGQMYSNNGPLIQMWDRLKKEQPQIMKSKVSWNPLFIFGSFLSLKSRDPEFWQKDPNLWENSLADVNLPNLKKDDKLARTGEELYDRISESYFSERTSEQVLQELNSDNLYIEAAPYMVWLLKNQFNSALLNKNPEDEAQRIWNVLFTESRACTEFKENMAAGRMGNYLAGLSKKTEDSDGSTVKTNTPTQPGSGGVRPKTPTQPGSGGVRPKVPSKPGSGGVRPGSGGVRPGNSSIRPCLDMRHRL